MATHRLMVFTRAMPGREAEFNDWYDEVHLKEVLEVEGFVAAQRFALAPSQIGDVGDEEPAPYLAIYEIEAESVEAALERLNASADGMNMSDALDLTSTKAIAYTAIGERTRRLTRRSRSGSRAELDGWRGEQRGDEAT